MPVRVGWSEGSGRTVGCSKGAPRAPHEQRTAIGCDDWTNGPEACCRVAPNGTKVRGVWIGLNDGDSWFAEQAVEEGANHATTQALVELVRLTKELIDSASARI